MNLIQEVKRNIICFTFESMKFKPGDKVQLINEAVEATVIKLHSETDVFVLDENGFEYKVKISEIVPLFDERTIAGNENDNEANDLSSFTEKSILKYFESPPSCYLCFVPHDSENLLNSEYSVIIVNTSEEILLYSIYFIEDASGYSSYGIAEPNTEVVAGITGNDFPIRSYKFFLRFLIHSEKSKTGQRQYSFTPEDFLHEKLFLTRDLFSKHILAFDIHANEEMEIPEGEIKKLVDYFTSEKIKPAKEPAAARKRSDETVLFTNEKTVDLHMEELTDDYSGMSNGEIINLQLTHFRKELDSAILNHYYRIIFIHGKGNGVLRNRIRSELETMNLKFKDADTSKFGLGATEVML